MPTIPTPIGIRNRAPVFLRNRRNASALTPDQLARFRAAFQASYGIGDNRGYAHFAGLHGLPLPRECDHTNTFWLPWHRAYLYFFEMSLRDIDPSVTLSWWDWTTGQMPAPFTTPAQGNPLTAATIPAAAGGPAQTVRNGPGPGSLPTKTAYDAVMAKTDWNDFTASLRGLHNQVHNAFGGSMRDPDVAAFDPIFWAHHTFVDRAWRIWQSNNTSAVFPASFLNTALAPFPMTVAQTMSVAGLGYDYARSTISFPFKPKNLPVLAGGTQ